MSDLREAIERYGEWLGRRYRDAEEMMDLLEEGGHSSHYDRGRKEMAQEAIAELKDVLAAAGEKEAE